MPRNKFRPTVQQRVAVEAALRICSEVDFYVNDEELGAPSEEIDDDWWEALSPAQKRKYLREHPGSSRAKGKGKGKGTSKLDKVKNFIKKAGSAYNTGKDLYDRYGRYVLPLIV